MSPVEVLAVIFGLACVVLTVRQNIWCWPTGLVQVVLYIYVFYGARLYSDLLLHVFYVWLQLYGWYAWVHGRPGASGRMPVTRLGGRGLVAACVGILAGAAAWGELMSRFTDAAAAHADAFVAVASLVAQYLLARKKLESWYLWIAVDIVAIGVYWSRDLWLTAGLYVVFLALCVAGLLAWQRAMVGSVHPVAVTAA